MSKDAYPDLINTLASISTFGFTTLQASAYIAILEIGEGTGSAIAGAAGINRSKIYDILGQLEEMDAIKIISKGGKKLYVAVPPEELFPRIEEKFKELLNVSKDDLLSIMQPSVDIDPKLMTLTTVNLKKLDANDYIYMIASSQRARVEFVDKLGKDSRPGKDVKILDMGRKNAPGLLMLLNEEEVLIFPTPKGRTTEALRFESEDIVRFFRGLVENWWTSDIPESVRMEAVSGSTKALYIGKSMHMLYTAAQGAERKYERPVSFIVTDKQIVFYYEGQAEPVLPTFAVSSVQIAGEALIVEFIRPDGNPIGTLNLKPVGDLYMLRNLLEVLSPKIAT